MRGLSFFTLAALTLLTATGQADAKDKLRLGMSPEPFMPFTQVNAAGQWEGFEADLSRALCAKMDVECELKPMAWDGLIPSLTEGKVDLAIAGFAITGERQKIVDFSSPYYKERTTLVGPKGDSASIATIDAPDGSGKILAGASFEGKIIGTQTATAQANYLAKFLPDTDVKLYDTADNAVADLVAGRLDYALLPDVIGNALVSGSQGADFEVKLELPSNAVLGNGIAYAVHKGDAVTLGRIDAALAALKAEKLLEQLDAKWVQGK